MDSVFIEMYTICTYNFYEDRVGSDESHGEQRFKTLALGPGLSVLLVVHAQQGPKTIRIISARKARRGEIRQYYRGVEHD